MGLIVLAISLASTFVFQAGLIGLLMRRFAATVAVALLYPVLSICLHVFSLVFCTNLRNKWKTEHYLKKIKNLDLKE
jgi:hypothetical protein